MTSIARKIKRSNPNYVPESRPQLTYVNEDGSYTTLHPTNGWKTISARRIKAQEAMMTRFGFIR